MKTWQIAYLGDPVGKKEYCEVKADTLSEAMASFFKSKKLDGLEEEVPMMNFYIKYLGVTNE